MTAEEWKNPAHFNRCARKRGFPSMRKAEIQAERASAKTGDLIIAYACFDCGMFHIGHADLSQRLAHTRLADRPCQHCGQTIPEEKTQKAKRFRTTALYCSDQCQRNAQRKRRTIRLRLQKQGEG